METPSEPGRPTRMLFLGEESLADGFCLIGFETYPDPAPEEVDRILRDLRRNQERAFVIVDDAVMRAEIPNLKQVRREGGRIVVIAVPAVRAPRRCSRARSRIAWPRCSGPLPSNPTSPGSDSQRESGRRTGACHPGPGGAPGGRVPRARRSQPRQHPARGVRAAAAARGARGKHRQDARRAHLPPARAGQRTQDADPSRSGALESGAGRGAPARRPDARLHEGRGGL